MVFATGYVDQAIKQGQLNYLLVLPAEALPLKTVAAQATQGLSVSENQVTYKLRLLDETDTVVQEQLLALTPLDDHSATSDPALFSTSFPAPAGSIAKVELLADNEIIDTLASGIGQPLVSILQPTNGSVIDANLTIEWSASDPDATDRLLFTVQYSHDAGVHWQTLVNDFPGSLTGTTVLKLADPGSLHGSDGATARIRVMASDGYHTAIADSQPFVLANRKPDVYIVSPGESQSFAADELVLLTGGATDTEDGGLGAAALAWAVDETPVGTDTQPPIQTANHRHAPSISSLIL
jgi:hypothetical protein